MLRHEPSGVVLTSRSQGPITAWENSDRGSGAVGTQIRIGPGNQVVTVLPLRVARRSRSGKGAGPYTT